MKKLFLLLAALTLSFQAHAASDADNTALSPPQPKLAFLARFSVDLVAPIWELGKTSDLGKRRIIPITGGSFKGPLINGEILNNGADWQTVTADGLAIIDTRYLLKLDDGELVYLQTRGVRYGPPEVMAEVAKGKPVDPSRYTFRLFMNFETASRKYDWLNRAMGVGYAMRLGNAVVYDAYLLN
ncbi:DUF3237 domain-containing protein [Herbaspirillum sp.]|uniref:DUF3237 domain-containing protein n=1 Tax=Herbaspirillum sp. TaxID=1890675 RepID=UPI0031D9F82E